MAKKQKTKRRWKKPGGRTMAIYVWVPKDLGELKIAYVAAWEKNKTFLRSLEIVGVG